jgi:hypothetical protein
LVVSKDDVSHLEAFCKDLGLPVESIFIQKYLSHKIDEKNGTRIIHEGESVGVHVT